MQLLTNTSTLLRIVTTNAATLDVQSCGVDVDTGPAYSVWESNTAISSAATTTIAPAPTGTKQRNVKRVNIENKDASLSAPIVVQKFDGSSAFQDEAVTLLPGECFRMDELGNWRHYDSQGAEYLPTTKSAFAQNVADVTASGADTYLTGASLAIGGRVQVGTRFRWRMHATKTAAGVAAPVFTVRTGANASTADTSRAAHTGVAQTAATDNGWFEYEAIVRDASAAGVLEVVGAWHHKNTTTGMANAAQVQIFQTTATAIDFTAATLFVGISCNPGASGVWTFQHVSLAAENLK